jgi:hypothetical protein
MLRSSPPRAAFFVGLCLASACVSEDRSTLKTVGAWQIDTVKVSGWEPGHSYWELRRNGSFVDRDIYIQEEYLQFFPPDCVVYRVRRVNAPFYAACGDKTPALLPSWVLSVTRRDILGGTITRGAREIRESAPIDEALEASRQQPPRTDDWQSKPHVAVDIEKRLIGSGHLMPHFLASTADLR